MCICIYIYIHVHVHVHRDHGGVCWVCVGKSGFQWKHAYGRVFPGVFGIANSLQNVAHSQKLWSLSGRSVGTVTTWLGGNGLCSSWCSRQPAWWHGCYRKEQFCVVAKPPKNTIVGVQTIKKVKKKSALWGTQWGQWKTTPKIHFDRYLRGFFWGVTAPTLSLFSFFYIALFGCI